MTSNQRRVITLAQAIRNFGLAPEDVADCDWDLLLLAAGLNNCRASLQAVAERVLNYADRSVGYFAPLREDESPAITPGVWQQGPAFACAARRY